MGFMDRLRRRAMRPTELRSDLNVDLGGGSVVREGTLIAGAGSSNALCLLPSDGVGTREWSGGVLMKLPYCIVAGSARVDRSSRVGIGRDADFETLRLEAPSLLRPKGAGLVRRGLLSSAFSDCGRDVNEPLRSSYGVNGVCGCRSPRLPRAGVPWARFTARATALTCFLPAL